MVASLPGEGSSPPAPHPPRPGKPPYLPVHPSLLTPHPALPPPPHAPPPGQLPYLPVHPECYLLKFFNRMAPTFEVPPTAICLGASYFQVRGGWSRPPSVV